MKKRILAGGAVLALAAIWTGTAWYTGKQVESRLAREVQALSAQVQRLGAKLNMPVTLELLSFERGVFSSTVRYGLKITALAGGNPVRDLDLQFIGKIEHGPFPASRLAAGQFAPAMAASLVRVAETPDASAWFAAARGAVPASVHMVLGYGQDISGGLEVAPVEYSDEQFTLSFSGLKARASYAADGMQSALSIASEKLALSAPIVGDAQGGRRKLSVEGLAVSHEYSALQQDAAKSGTRVTVKDWLLEAGKLPLGLKDIALTVETNMVAARMNGTLTVDLGAISLEGQRLGKLRLAVGGKDMDVASFKAFQDTYAEKLRPDTYGDSTPEDKMLAGSYIVKFLMARPSFTLSPLEVETAGGVSSLSLDVGLDSPTFWNIDPRTMAKETVSNLTVRLMLSPEGLADLFAARMQLKGEAREASRIAAGERAASVRDMFIAKQWGKMDSGKIAANLDYRDGQVDFNGERMSLEAFIGKVLAD
ncbi:YdgA family protein [Achromobacter deleyi]|uniref:YdgA family protein n=1 Tax=Achromobacter deleyi TaxID=1353891 RepID=UPI001490D4AF|nr:YdgA family protein [Achromobacter deleyi]QVQ25337.1 YdgA family protein [Achromobacter deleyi]UIP20879.1 YdgA family protein [Achromobacter deleyi]